jgi:hypothetical protein
VRFGDRLREAFATSQTGSVEVLAAPDGGLVDLRHVIAVWVDPVATKDHQLIDMVEGLARTAGVPLRVRRRTLLDSSRLEVWRGIVQVLSDGEKPLIHVLNRADASPAFRAWAASMEQSGMAWMWDRFSRYLYNGTLLAMSAAAGVRERDALATEPPPWLGRQREPRVAQVATANPSAPTKHFVRACGHPVQPWDNGTCYACVGRARSSWRYDT